MILPQALLGGLMATVAAAGTGYATGYLVGRSGGHESGYRAGEAAAIDQYEAQAQRMRKAAADQTRAAITRADDAEERLRRTQMHERKVYVDRVKFVAPRADPRRLCIRASIVSRLNDDTAPPAEPQQTEQSGTSESAISLWAADARAKFNACREQVRAIGAALDTRGSLP